MVTGSRKFVERRRSRRVSLPVIGHTPRFQTSLSEARAMVAEMLSLEDVPPQLATGLRCVSGLLSQNHPASSFSDSSIQPRIAEDPVTGEQVCLTSKLSGPRVSPLVWSTVTSATGLPTVEPEPCRSRSSSCWKRHRSSEIDDASPSPSAEEDSSNDTETRITVRDGTKFDIVELNNDPFLARVAELDFPIFELSRRSPETLLTEVSYKIFAERNLFSIFGVNLRKFFCFFHDLEMGYYNIPYHNRIHATDVAQLVYCLFKKRMGCVVDAKPTEPPEDQNLCELLSSLEVMALCTAAAMHDYEHPGRTNAFLVATRDSKAVLYNDRSVLENHHAAASWKVLAKLENNWIECLDDAEYRRFRYLVIEAILSTDLKRHFDILSEFNAKVADDQTIDWENEQDRLLICQLCIKLADISSPSRPGDMHRIWTDRILEEFYQQGDEERQKGCPVSAYMDRANPQVAKLQDSFIIHVVSPLADVMNQHGLLPKEDAEDESSFIVNLRYNHKMWLSELESTSGSFPRTPSTSEMAVISERDDENRDDDTEL